VKTFSGLAGAEEGRKLGVKVEPPVTIDNAHPPAPPAETTGPEWPGLAPETTVALHIPREGARRGD